MYTYTNKKALNNMMYSKRTAFVAPNIQVSDLEEYVNGCNIILNNMGMSLNKMIKPMLFVEGKGVTSKKHLIFAVRKNVELTYSEYTIILSWASQLNMVAIDTFIEDFNNIFIIKCNFNRSIKKDNVTINERCIGHISINGYLLNMLVHEKANNNTVIGSRQIVLSNLHINEIMENIIKLEYQEHKCFMTDFNVTKINANTNRSEWSHSYKVEPTDTLVRFKLIK